MQVGQVIPHIFSNFIINASLSFLLLKITYVHGRKIRNFRGKNSCEIIIFLFMYIYAYVKVNMYVPTHTHSHSHSNTFLTKANVIGHKYLRAPQTNQNKHFNPALKAACSLCHSFGNNCRFIGNCNNSAERYHVPTPPPILWLQEIWFSSCTIFNPYTILLHT